MEKYNQNKLKFWPFLPKAFGFVNRKPEFVITSCFLKVFSALLTFLKLNGRLSRSVIPEERVSKTLFTTVP